MLCTLWQTNPKLASIKIQSNYDSLCLNNIISKGGHYTQYMGLRRGESDFLGQNIVENDILGPTKLKLAIIYFGVKYCPADIFGFFKGIPDVNCHQHVLR